MTDQNKSATRFEKVIVFSGHMTDLPERKEARFPESKTAAVSERIARQLEEWSVGPKDLAICGGARGGDILFTEAAQKRGAEVWLFLPLAEEEFLDKSVRHPESDWESRYRALCESENVKVFYWPERLNELEGESVFARNNLLMLDEARAEAVDPENLYAVLVWDEQPTGDGPGGTSDFAARVKEMGGQLAPVINPTKL